MARASTRAVSTTCKATLLPEIVRTQTSRPRRSVPHQWPKEGGA